MPTELGAMPVCHKAVYEVIGRPCPTRAGGRAPSHPCLRGVVRWHVSQRSANRELDLQAPLGGLPRSSALSQEAVRPVAPRACGSAEDRP